TGMAAGGGTKRAPAFLRQNGEVTIPLFTTENDPNTLDFYERTITAFQEEHPEVDLEITLYQDENQLQYLTTAFETGTDLGIFAPPSAQVATWVRQGHLLPISPIVQQIGEDDFLPGTRIVVDGDDYAMPFQSNASALWCRVDLLEGAGLAPPTTYEEYLAAAQALHGQDGLIGVASATGAVPQLTLQYFTPYIHQAGWDYFDREGNLTFDQPEVLEAVNRFVEIMRNSSASLYNGTFQDVLTAFISGRAVFGTFPGRLGVNLAAQNPELAERVTVVPVPGGPFMPGQLLFGGIQHYAVYAETEHSDEALAFLEFMTTGERSLDFAMTVPGHLLPPLESVRALVPSHESEFMTTYGDWVIALNEMVPNAFSPALSMGAVSNGQYLGRFSNLCPWASRIWGGPPVDGTMFQEILINDTDPEEAWTAASETMGAEAEAWKAENPDWTPEPLPAASPTA
ncbi:MAG: ABC transporter substrate-binding protein, partial [Thermomicrobiales bacterium]